MTTLSSFPSELCVSYFFGFFNRSQCTIPPCAPTPPCAGTRVTVSHGADIAKMPAGSFLHMANMQNAVDKQSGSHAVLGIAPTGRGTVAVFGDSNCLDNSHQVSACYNFFLSLLDSMQVCRGAEADEG